MSWRWEKLDESWRYPRGRDNKARLQYKGKPPLVKIGYRSPKLVRYLHPSGRQEVLVYRPEDLYNIDPLTQAVRIAANVGGRKRLEIIKFAEKFGIRVLNPGRIPEIIPAEAPERPRPEELEAITEEIEKEVEKIEAPELAEEKLEEELKRLEEEGLAEEALEERTEEITEELERELEKELEQYDESEGS